MEEKRNTFAHRGVREGLAVLTGALLIVGITWHGFAAGSMASASSNAVVAAAASVAETQTPAIAHADIVKVVAPAVVTIRTEGRARVVPTGADPDELFRRFFGGQFDLTPRPGQRQVPRQMPAPGRGPRQSALGSGVIVSRDGYLLTNNHVIDGADSIHVNLTDGRTIDAKVVGTDEPSDLAVLKIEASDLHPLALGNSDAVEIGDVVLAVGNPLGLGQTVTMGIISAKGRSTDGEGYEDFLQTDAPINHGNSGGALVSMKGELIGINSQIASVSDGNIGIGFAIPANMAKSVMTDLKSGGKVRRAQLGVGIQPVDSDIAASLGLKQVTGVVVNSVTSGSAADKAGMKRGDVIKSFNGQPVQDTNSLRNRVAESVPGSNATVVVIRDGSEKTLTVKLDEKEPVKSASSATGSPAEDKGALGALGVSVEPLTAELARRADVPNGVKGLLVEEVNPDSRAADAGIRPGDVIEEVNRQPVQSVDDLRAAVRKSADRPALLLVSRGGRDIFVTVKPS
jgi:Do/DeqQ family serine protease